MKGRVPHDFVLNAPLATYLEQYLQNFRPFLLAAHVDDRLWISTRHSPMTEQAIYYAICRTTERRLGRPIPPHLFRDCAATSMAEIDSAGARTAAALLAHRSLETTERHYLHVDARKASRRYGPAVLAALQRSPPEQHEETDP